MDSAVGGRLNEGVHLVETSIPTPVPELSECHLRIYYLSLAEVYMARFFDSNFSCILPSKHIITVPQLA